MSSGSGTHFYFQWHTFSLLVAHIPSSSGMHLYFQWHIFLLPVAHISTSSGTSPLPVACIFTSKGPTSVIPVARIFSSSGMHLKFQCHASLLPAAYISTSSATHLHFHTSLKQTLTPNNDLWKFYWLLVAKWICVLVCQFEWFLMTIFIFQGSFYTLIMFSYGFIQCARTTTWFSSH